MGNKGIGAEIAAVTLVFFSVAAAGTLFLTFESISEGQEDSRPEIDNNLEAVELENFYQNYNKYKAVVSNEGETASNVSITQFGENLNYSVIPAGETRTLDIGCLKSNSDTVQISAGTETRDEVVEAESLDEIGVAEGYCIEIIDTEITDSSLKTYKIWTGKVYRNNIGEDPYRNSELEVSFDGETRTIETDNDGNFRVQERWDTLYVEPDGKWSREIEYSRTANTVDFHRGRGKFQPPNRLRLDFEDGSSQVYQTQGAFKQTESDKISMLYDVIPQSFSEDYVELKVNVQLTAKDGLEQDWNSMESNSDLLYQVPIPSSGGYAEINSLECSSSDGVECETGELTQQLESSTDGKRFEKSTLPTDDSGDKYIPVDMTVSSTGMPFIGSLTSYSQFRYEGDWKRFRVDEREIFIPEDVEQSYTQRVKPERVDDILSNRFNDDSADAERNYRQYFGLVSTIDGWWNAPRMARADGMYSLNSETEFDGSPGSYSIDNVLYNWSEVSSGQEYDLNFTVKLARSGTDTKFMLPINLGAFGLFPDTGGKAHRIYNRGGVRYPPYGQTGAYSFATTIPATDTSKAMTYKITKPLGDGKWKAKTYLLNTADRKIDNIYLLNSQGEFKEFEGGTLEGGEELSETVNLEDNQDKKIQLNMQFQTIDGSISYPEYEGWPYDARIDIQGENSYSFDISGSVDCNRRYCINYRTGNRDEARRIDNIAGKAAPRAVFDENIDSVSFYMKNGEETDGSQGLKNLGFWIWYMQPYENNIRSALVRPENMRIETVENGGLEPGVLERDFG